MCGCEENSIAVCLEDVGKVVDDAAASYDDVDISM